MNIEIKKSEKPVIYEDAKKMMEERLLNVDLNKSNELIWTLEHPDIYTAGTSYNESDILDKSIKILETNRGGKITYHGPGQLICYFVIDLKKRNKDFHARYSAKNRIYNYVINNRLSIPVLEKDRSWHVIRQLNVALMKKVQKS